MIYKNTLYKLAFITTLASLSLSSCNMEERRLKNALEDAVNTEGQDYELVEYHLVESVTKGNVEDSIRHYDYKIEFERDMMGRDSIELKSKQKERDKCIYQKAHTMAHIAYMYNSVIRDWEEMIEDDEEKIAKRQEKINGYKEMQGKWQKVLDSADEEIVYNIYSHAYKLDGKLIEEETLLKPDNKPFNFE